MIVINQILKIKENIRIDWNDYCLHLYGPSIWELRNCAQSIVLLLFSLNEAMFIFEYECKKDSININQINEELNDCVNIKMCEFGNAFGNFV